MADVATGNDARASAAAVWDIVRALGIPEFTVKLERVDTFRFADTRLTAKVHHGLHAVTVDEERTDFTPILWDPDDRIVRVLFPGRIASV